MDYVKLLKSAVDGMADSDQELAQHLLQVMVKGQGLSAAPVLVTEAATEKTTTVRRRSPGSGRRGHLYKAVEIFGTGGTVRQIGDKARELGLRLPPDPTKQDRSVLGKMLKSPGVYKKNEDDTWRLVRLPKNGPATTPQPGLPLQ